MSISSVLYRIRHDVECKYSYVIPYLSNTDLSFFAISLISLFLLFLSPLELIITFRSKRYFVNSSSKSFITGSRISLSELPLRSPFSSTSHSAMRCSLKKSHFFLSVIPQSYGTLKAPYKYSRIDFSCPHSIFFRLLILIQEAYRQSILVNHYRLSDLYIWYVFLLCPYDKPPKKHNFYKNMYKIPPPYFKCKAGRYTVKSRLF